jgi:hypothetical protein
VQARRAQTLKPISCRRGFNENLNSSLGVSNVVINTPPLNLLGMPHPPSSGTTGCCSRHLSCLVGRFLPCKNVVIVEESGCCLPGKFRAAMQAKSGWEKDGLRQTIRAVTVSWKPRGLKFVYLTRFLIGSTAFILPLSFDLCSCQAKEELVLLRNLVNCTKCPLF